MSRQAAVDDALRASAARDQGQQPLPNANAHSQGNDTVRNNQMRTPAASTGGASFQEQTQLKRSNGDRNWGARIRASIARLIEIDGLCLDPKSSAKEAEKRKAREEEQAFHARADQLKEASDTAHTEYWSRLRDVYSASTAKKMRLTTRESPTPAVTTSASRQCRNEHEALDTLAVAAATEQFNPNKPVPPAAKKPKRSSRRHNALPSYEEGTGSERNSVQVHDPALAKAVDKLAGKLTELLGQLQATSDAAAAEPILAAAATVALEATEMRRREEMALTRMVEIEEHRQQIMQGLLEYAKRKEQREMDEGGNKGGNGR
ncbi:hypothetical protein PR003_g9654 [Phytophthora rubi]|uniref:Uncharacterized protein n=1 Tax=Phytophthora rubi TaxID=129364 RepID=A0A6A3N277_9STRA|nr:hypothetical protein PR002_g9515 [Phytophthora rubi]KAE9035633.1 hypothetical protein PR001_g9219 [Phytophthora rubi]KAE9342090.1 hypothetical protein PR003_g9654 [Phytophthora rubi]